MLRCASSLRYTGLWHRAYSVWFQLYAIGYQPYANDRRPAFEIFFSNLSSKVFITLVVALCAGCVGIEKSYPDKRYFVLEVPANPSPANPTASETLEVSNIRVSPRYADKGFVYRTSEAGYESDFYNQFLVCSGFTHHRGSSQRLNRVAGFQICHRRIEPIATKLRFGRHRECALWRLSQRQLTQSCFGDGVFLDQ